MAGDIDVYRLGDVGARHRQLEVAGRFPAGADLGAAWSKAIRALEGAATERA